MQIISPNTCIRMPRSQAAVYGMAQTLPDRGLVNEMCEQFVDAMYSTKNN